MTPPSDSGAIVDRFLSHLRDERNVSPQTVRAYASDLARYLEWAERSGVDPLASDPRQMRRYLAELDQAHHRQGGEWIDPRKQPDDQGKDEKGPPVKGSHGRIL